MSNVLDMIGGDHSPAIQQLSTQFGLTPEQASSAVRQLMPLVTAGLSHEAATKGEAGVMAALTGGRHEQYLTQPEKLVDPATITDGNAILGHIFGNKDGSRKVAAEAAQKSGIDPAVLQKMLPIVAAIVMGMLSRKANAQNQSAPSAPSSKPGGLGGILGSLLDRDKDGSVIDDIGSILGGTKRG